MRKPPFTWEQLADATLRLPDAVAPATTVEFYVDHTTQYGVMGPLDLTRATDERPLSHTLELRIPRAFLEDLGRQRAPRGTWRRLAALPGVTVSKSVGPYDSPEVTIGRLTVGEYPDRFRYDRAQRSVVSWFEWLDADGTELGALADKAEDDVRFNFAPGDGSLFWFVRLGVHPAFRRQHLGARLLAHALWVLPRHSEDLALMKVMPIECMFGGPPPVRTRAAILRLTRYYQRLGLKRWPGRRERRPLPPYARRSPDSAEMEPPTLYFLGASLLPFAKPQPAPGRGTVAEDAAA
jgi:GNAT superfamily N-acetyltransferase